MEFFAFLAYLYYAINDDFCFLNLKLFLAHFRSVKTKTIRKLICDLEVQSSYFCTTPIHSHSTSLSFSLSVSSACIIRILVKCQNVLVHEGFINIPMLIPPSSPVEATLPYAGAFAELRLPQSFAQSRTRCDLCTWAPDMIATCAFVQNEGVHHKH